MQCCKYAAAWLKGRILPASRRELSATGFRKTVGGLEMTEDNNKGTKKGGKALTYVRLILIAIILIALVCGLGKLVIWMVGDVIAPSGRLPFFKTWRAIVIGFGFLICLIVITIDFITSIPDTAREVEHDKQTRSARDDAFLGEYFSDDKKIRDEMINILHTMDRNLYSSADEACVRLLERCRIPEEQAAILYCRMVCREEMGYTKEAIEYGEKAVSLRKSYVPALLKTAQLCIKINKFTAAEQYLLELQELSPQDVQISRMLYLVYAGKHDHEKALAAAMQWEELEPYSAEAAAGVCRSAHKCGKSDIVNSRLQKCASEHYEGYAALKKEVRGY